MAETSEPKPESPAGKPTESPAEEVQVPKFKAISLLAHGASKHMRVDLIECNKPKPHEIEVTVEACGVNFLDIMSRQGLSEHAVKPPYTMGSECAGTVTAVGESVTEYKVGDRVVVLVDHGAWSEKLCVSPVVIAADKDASKDESSTSQSSGHPSPTALVLPWPSGISATQAAIMAFAYLPAYFLLHHVGHVKPGDVVLVHSAGGGVGTAIGQLAKHIQGVKLIGIASKPKHEKLAPYFELLLTPNEDHCAEVKKSFPKGVDVVLDCVNNEELSKSLNILKPLGRYILYGASCLISGDRKNILNITRQWFIIERTRSLRLHEENRIVGGFCLKSLLFGRPQSAGSGALPLANHDLVRQAWTELTRQIDERLIDPWVDSVWAFDQVKEAMAHLQERKNVGKVALVPKKQEQAE